MKKLRVLVANEPANLGGVDAWRIFWPFDLLERTYPDEIEFVYSRGQILPYEFFQCDVVFCQRPFDASHMQALQMAKMHRKPIIIDFDDNFLNVPTGHADFKYLWNKGSVLAQCLQMADAIWVTTPALKEAYQHPNCTVIPNAILPETLPAEFNGNIGTVLWRGDVANAEDVACWRGEYERMLQRVEKFIWLRYMPSWASDASGKTLLNPEWIPTQIYLDTLRNYKPAAIWKPLLPCLINDGKSNISLLEATYAGGICVTNYARKPGWEYALRELPRKEADYATAWQRAADDIRQHYDLRAWNEVRFREFLKLVNG